VEKIPLHTNRRREQRWIGGIVVRLFLDFQYMYSLPYLQPVTKKGNAMTKTALINPENILAAVIQDDMIAFCTACGEEHYGYEPDARECACGKCGEWRVYGCDELLQMGFAD